MNVRTNECQLEVPYSHFSDKTEKLIKRKLKDMGGNIKLMLCYSLIIDFFYIILRTALTHYKINVMYKL